MNWLRRTRPTPAPEETPQAPTERAAPGIAALFAELSEDGSHAVLDFGAAAETSLRLYSRFARRIRFADLLTDPPHGEAWAAALRALPPHPDQPYDLVLAWNLLDRLAPEERPPLVERLTQLTTPGARLYVVVDASGEPNTQPVRFTLLDVDRVCQQAVGPPHPPQPQLLPAEVERLLAPFRVMHGFTLKLGLREYVAVRGESSASSTSSNWPGTTRAWMPRRWPQEE
ncbi:MAG: hypothetical protein KAJ42_08135 [Gemmatimonadetes bacterium]|nr:hypothetical protein [Gemmatimonadota bacterium]